MHSQPSERAAVAATIDPANLNNSTTDSDWIDLSKFREALFILIAGVIDNTIDFKLREAKDGSGTSAQDLTGKAITQETGGDDDNKQWVVNVKAEELTVNSGYTHVSARVTIGNGTTNLLGLVGLGMKAAYGPASDFDLSSVSQIIT